MTALRVETPRGGWQAEKIYAAKVTFRDLLGLAVDVFPGQARHWVIHCGEKQFSLPNLFFPEEKPDRYLSKDSLPALPLQQVDSAALGMSGVQSEQSLPVLWGRASVSSGADIDILGGIFFLVTRYEEVAAPVTDEFGRFPAKASLANVAGYLRRPLADEYGAVLWQLVREIAPSIARPSPVFRLQPTHDVDWPTRWIRATPVSLARGLVADLIKRRSVKHARSTLSSYRDWRLDPLHCFDWIMSQSERHGLQSSFFFLAGAKNKHWLGDAMRSLTGSGDPKDPGYDPGHPQMRRLFDEIVARGHEVGLHGSYSGFMDAREIGSERARLNALTAGAIRGGRQHYLRFRVPQTWRAWDEAGFDYDSTASFADHAGFRCGTANEFTTFDLQAGRSLKLRERPLIIMEVSLLDPDYQGLDHAAAADEARLLMDRARPFGGKFVFLWHNNNLLRPEDRELYSQLLAHG